jgi:hypothetical protein
VYTNREQKLLRRAREAHTGHSVEHG